MMRKRALVPLSHTIFFLLILWILDKAACNIYKSVHILNINLDTIVFRIVRIQCIALKIYGSIFIFIVIGATSKTFLHRACVQCLSYVIKAR